MKCQFLNQNHQLLINNYHILIIHFNRVTNTSTLLHQRDTRGKLRPNKKLKKINVNHSNNIQFKLRPLKAK
jgi:uncharacterized membrane protein affecting hemolysin expression